MLHRLPQHNEQRRLGERTETGEERGIDPVGLRQLPGRLSEASCLARVGLRDRQPGPNPVRTSAPSSAL